MSVHVIYDSGLGETTLKWENIAEFYVILLSLWIIISQFHYSRCQVKFEYIDGNEFIL